MGFLESLETDFSDIIRADFSEPVTITQGLLVTNTKGIFDETFLEIDPDTQAEVMSRNPRILIYQKNLSIEIKQGDLLFVRGKQYKAVKPQSDGQGSIQVKLHVA